MKTIDPLPPHLDNLANSLAQRQMLRPALLFLSGHRPFSFIIGQGLLLALPLNLLFPAWPLRAWAEIFSHPQGMTYVERALRGYIDPSNPPTQAESPSPPAH